MDKSRPDLIIAKDLGTLYKKAGISKKKQQNIVKMIEFIHRTGGIKESIKYNNKGIPKLNLKKGSKNES